MSAKPIPALLYDLIERAKRILEVYERHSSVDAFMKDQVAKDAVLWNFVVIGEACNRLGREFHEMHPAIPWAAMVGLRNIVAHGYDVVDWPIVYSIIDQDLRTLIENAQNLLDEFGPPPEN